MYIVGVGGPAVCAHTHQSSLDLMESLYFWCLIAIEVHFNRASMLKLHCCAFDALIKKSNFYAELKQEKWKDEEKQAQMFKEIQSLFLVFASSLWDGKDTFAVYSRGGLFQQKRWKMSHLATSASSSHIETKSPPGAFGPPTGQHRFSLCLLFLLLCFHSDVCFFLHLLANRPDLESGVDKMTLHPPLVLEGWDDNHLIHWMKLQERASCHSPQVYACLFSASSLGSATQCCTASPA